MSDEQKPINGLSENVSDNPTRKRGRPALLGEERRVYRSLWPDHGGRSLQNQYYACLAGALLGDVPECAWLFEKDDRGEYLRWTLHQELGRFPSAEAALDAALAICESKPKVKQGVIFLRRWRLEMAGKQPRLEGDPDALRDELLNVLNDFVTRYPKTRRAVILRVLDRVSRDVQFYGPLE